MEVLTLFKEVIDGRVIIDLPSAYNHQKVKIIVAKDTDDETNWATLSGQKRLEALRSFKGADKFPDFEINDYDVYNQ